MPAERGRRILGLGAHLTSPTAKRASGEPRLGLALGTKSRRVKRSSAALAFAHSESHGPHPGARTSLKQPHGGVVELLALQSHERLRSRAKRGDRDDVRTQLPWRVSWLSCLTPRVEQPDAALLQRSKRPRHPNPQGFATAATPSRSEATGGRSGSGISPHEPFLRPLVSLIC